MKKLFSTLFIAVFSSGAFCSLPLGYRLQKEINLEKEGTLQLLVDSRINEKAELEAIPEDARNAILILSKNKFEVSRKLLDKPKADIQLLKGNTGEKVFFFVTEDWSAGFGSYNGPISILYSIENHQFVKASTKVELMRSLKTDWKIQEKGRNGFAEIFSVSCRPDFKKFAEKISFKVLYLRYAFDGQIWKEFRRDLKGFWENDESFPSEELFP
jgi:hypothetical protein